MKRIKAAFQSLLLVTDTPEHTARSFSIGIFLGFSPLIGLHIILGIVVATGFRLNKTAVLLGIFMNNPWVVVPFYGLSTWVGIQLLGLPEGASLPEAGFFDLLQASFWSRLLSQWRLLIPAVIGSSLLSIILSVCSYFLVLLALRRSTRGEA